MASISSFLTHLVDLHKTSDYGNLFQRGEHSPLDLLSKANTINQFAFYGRCMGFQFSESIKPILKFIAICMASFSEAYYSSGGKIKKATNSMFTSGKYLMDPELRSRRIVNISQNSSVDFCKVRRFLFFFLFCGNPIDFFVLVLLVFDRRRNNASFAGRSWKSRENEQSVHNSARTADGH